MAKFDTMGLDALVLNLDEIGDIPEDVLDNMLEAGGRVIVNAHKAELQEQGLVKSHKLVDSVAIHKKATNSNHGIGSGDFRPGIDTKYVLIYPKGTHHTYKAKAGTYTKMNWGRPGETKTKGGGTANATNQDVAFVHEFGGHGNTATQWMRVANEKHAGEAVEAEAAVFFKWQQSHNL